VKNAEREFMSGLHDRISDVLLGTGKSNEELGQILGVNKNTISAYKNKQGDLKGMVLEGVVRNFRINPIWLLTGEGPKFFRESIGIQTIDKKAHRTILKALEDYIEEEGIYVTSEQKSDALLMYYEGYRKEKTEREKQGLNVEISDLATEEDMKNKFHFIMGAVGL
jgi:hypothetical protein